jgi:hypothetical protein
MTDRPVSLSPSGGSRLSSPSLSRPAPGVEMLAFFETLLALLPPAGVSDRTCFRRVAEWLAEGVRAGRFNAEVFPRVLLYAREASEAQVRSRHAVFLSILRKEMGYVPKSARP